MTLYIRAENAELRNMIKKQIENHRFTDSGFDIPMLANNIDMSTKTTCFSLGIRVAVGDSRPCLLLPRSSIYKTPFRLCNSIGLIDSGYRGEVKAMVDNLKHEYIMPIGEGTRMFQICRHNFLPWDSIVIVDELPAATDDRGSGGFGSTGLQLENHPRT
jgi:dUTP pyrophosphatase